MTSVVVLRTSPPADDPKMINLIERCIALCPSLRDAALSQGDAGMARRMKAALLELEEARVRYRQ